MLYKINQSIFESENNTLIVNGQTIDCPINVSQALTLFLQSKNQVVSKEMLMTAIWGEIIVSDDSLFKIVQGVRKIFKQAGLQDALINVYGKGYKIEPHISIIQKSDVKTPKEKANIKKQGLMLFTLISIILVIYFFNKNTLHSPLINPTIYQELKILGKSEAPELLSLLNNQYPKQDLMLDDKIQIAYLKGYGYFKQGDYSNSINQLKAAIEVSQKNNPILATADAYTLLANIYVYQSKYDEMRQHLDSAENIYTQFSNAKGLSAVALSRGRYFMSIDDFDQSFEVFEQLMLTSKNNHDVLTQIDVLYNTSHMHQLVGDLQQAQLELKQMLELSLTIGDGENLAKAYSSLSGINKQQGNFNEAMKQAQLTIRYAIDQNDTNRFQQSFSSLYNILNELGHQNLAEHYLQVALDFQYSRNSDGRLTIAELNLGILNLQKHNYEKAQTIFENLMSYQLPSTSHLETKAWLALARYFQQDNINAYSLSHEVYNHKESTNRTKLVAGIALALANFELERYTDSEKIFRQLENIEKDNWLIEKTYFIDMVLYIFNDRGDIQHNQYLTIKHDFNQKLNDLKLKTKPEESFLKALDNYINTIFKP